MESIIYSFLAAIAAVSVLKLIDTYPWRKKKLTAEEEERLVVYTKLLERFKLLNGDNTYHLYGSGFCYNLMKVDPKLDIENLPELITYQPPGKEWCGQSLIERIPSSY